MQYLIESSGDVAVWVSSIKRKKHAININLIDEEKAFCNFEPSGGVE